MKKIEVHFENCYGIRALKHTFDFTKKSVNLIYAPNGMMKSSFAKTFQDHSNDEPSSDRIYTDRTTVRNIRDEVGNDISAESVFVIEPYASAYQSERVSTLLANKNLKAEYDKILSGIDSKTDALLSLMQKTSGVKSGFDEVLSTTFTKQKDNLLRALERVKGEVLSDPEDKELEGIKYSNIFNPKVEALLQDQDIRVALDEYTDNYDNLLTKSRFFRKGVFNHYQADQIAKQLKTHGFFKADHRISLNSGEDETRIETEAELEKVIREELDSILADEALKASFDKIDKKLTTKELREFRDFLLERKTLVPRLKNMELLKEELLKGYLRQHKDSFIELMNEYDAGKKRLDELATSASEEATRWQEVINIFNRRFSVPFKVEVANKEDVILKRVTPNIGFTFEDESGEAAVVERSGLMEVLSQGERRALYILNIIFEVQARIEDGIPTVFIIDDIADSFDYKNKYAIVEYLADIAEQENFRQIILTHNYDFYRTVWKRLELGGTVFHVARTSEGVVLTAETMYSDPFQKWKNSANDVSRNDCLFAMIPFVRNLAEYCCYQAEFDELTTALHVKLAQPDLTVGKMLEIYKSVLNGHEFETVIDKTQPVIPLILKLSKEICENEESTLDLERKVVLSIGIRLLAEKFMIEKISDDEWVKSISKHQTAKLIRRYKEKFVNDSELGQHVSLLDRVNLMTPENIHLNSFMYEPILDMSFEHLKSLHSELIAVVG